MNFLKRESPREASDFFTGQSERSLIFYACSIGCRYFQVFNAERRNSLSCPPAGFLWLGPYADPPRKELPSNGETFPGNNCVSQIIRSFLSRYREERSDPIGSTFINNSEIYIVIYCNN